MKFKVGDFIANGDGFVAKVADISYEKEEYTLKYTNSYLPSIILKDRNSAEWMMILPSLYYDHCGHEIINCGFNIMRFICKKCGEEFKPKD
jgi:hypothetical protein